MASRRAALPAACPGPSGQDQEGSARRPPVLDRSGPCPGQLELRTSRQPSATDRPGLLLLPPPMPSTYRLSDDGIDREKAALDGPGQPLAARPGHLRLGARRRRLSSTVTLCVVTGVLAAAAVLGWWGADAAPCSSPPPLPPCDYAKISASELAVAARWSHAGQGRHVRARRHSRSAGLGQRQLTCGHDRGDRSAQAIGSSLFTPCPPRSTAHQRSSRPPGPRGLRSPEE